MLNYYPAQNRYAQDCVNNGEQSQKSVIIVVVTHLANIAKMLVFQTLITKNPSLCLHLTRQSPSDGAL